VRAGDLFSRTSRRSTRAGALAVDDEGEARHGVLRCVAAVVFNDWRAKPQASDFGLGP